MKLDRYKEIQAFDCVSFIGLKSLTESGFLPIL